MTFTSSLTSSSTGVIHAKVTDTTTFTGAYTKSGAGWGDFSTDITKNIVITKTCTIYFIVCGRFGHSTTSSGGDIQAIIGGTTINNNGHSWVTAFDGAGRGGLDITSIFVRTGVTAGTITCKIQGVSDTAQTLTAKNIGLFILAVQE